MTSQTGKDRFDWRRAIIGGVSGGAIAVALMSGFGVSTAFAQPADPATPSAADGNCTGDDCAKRDADPWPRRHCTGDDCARETPPRHAALTARRPLTVPKTGSANRR